MTDCKAGFNDPVHDAQAVFRYALDAMAHPGLWYELRSMPQVLPGFSPAATALALTLLDHEVGVWLGASARRGVNALSLITGARRVDRPDEADFAFLAANELDMLPVLAAGTAAAPELGATVILEVDAASGDSGLICSGPGLAAPQRLLCSGLPEAFARQWWHQTNGWPCGRDIFLAASSSVAALPRTVTLEAA